ncbi:MAG: type II CAAX endopeptidase family protein [Terricaulis sp.]
MWRNIGVSFLKILVFVLIWAGLTSVAVWTMLSLGGPGFYARPAYSVSLEVALTIATLAPAILLARFVDTRSLSSLGFSARLQDLLIGAVLGAAIFCVPIVILLAVGAARFSPELHGFSAFGLAVGLFACFFNVVTQEALVRSYMFQELWAKYGAWVATIITTIIFVALHAAAIAQGTQGLIAGANILVASLMLSLAYVRTGQLWLAIGLHLGWNGLQGPVLGIAVTGNDIAFGHWSVFSFPGDALLTGGEMGVEGGLAGLAGPLAGLALVALLFKQQPKPDFARVALATK